MNGNDKKQIQGSAGAAATAGLNSQPNTSPYPTPPQSKNTAVVMNQQVASNQTQTAQENLGQQVPIVAQAQNDPADIKSVITRPPKEEKPKVVVWLIIGLLILIIVGVGGFYLYTKQSREESDQTPASSAPILLPTDAPIPTPTLVDNENQEVVEKEEVVGCSLLDLNSPELSYIDGYCSGALCNSKTTKEECEVVDVVAVATDSGRLLEQSQQDGIGDCVWDEEASGFGDKCKVKYQ